MNFLTFSVQSLWPVAILLAASVAIPIILSICKIKFIPSLVLEIIIGVSFAFIPGIKDFFGEGLHLNDFSEGIYVIGMSVLLFLSGLDTDYSVFKKSFKGENEAIKELKLGLIFFGLVLLLSFGVSFIFIKEIPGSKVAGISLLTVLFSSTFASLVIPLIHDHDLAKTTIGKILSTYATVAEFFSIIGLSIVMIALRISTKQVTGAFFWIALILVAVFLIVKFIPIDKIFGKNLEGIVHLETRAITFILFICILLADLAGAEYILGAFIAGMVYKGIHLNEKEVEHLEAFGYGIFVPMFYILVGYKVGSEISLMGSSFFTGNNILLIFGIFLCMILVRIPFLFLCKFYKINTVIPSLFISTSTIIVAIAIEHISHVSGVFTSNIIVAMILASLISVIIPPILFRSVKEIGEAKTSYKDVILEPSDF